MKTYRIIFSFLLSLLTLFFFSCGGAPSETAETEEAPEEVAVSEPEPEPTPEPEPEPTPEPEPEPTPAPEAESSTLKIAYSDWPGWVAWEIAIQKKWFEEAGVDVEFLWFDYVASMDAYVAGQVDAVCMTNGMHWLPEPPESRRSESLSTITPTETIWWLPNPGLNPLPI